MKSKTFLVEIGWCPDKVDEYAIRDLLESEFGTNVEVIEK